MKNSTMATSASAKMMGWMMTPPAMAMISRMIPRMRSMAAEYPSGRTATLKLQPALTIRLTVRQRSLRPNVNAAMSPTPARYTSV